MRYRLSFRTSFRMSVSPELAAPGSWVVAAPDSARIPPTQVG
jgi:hypothetical protein